jgi:hypothetical protein
MCDQQLISSKSEKTRDNCRSNFKSQENWILTIKEQAFGYVPSTNSNTKALTLALLVAWREIVGYMKGARFSQWRLLL